MHTLDPRRLRTPLATLIALALFLAVGFATPAYGASTVPVYRLANPYDGQHLLTTSFSEWQNLKGHGWDDEGIRFHCRLSDGQAIYRLYNPSNGDHLYTTSPTEYSELGRNGWRGEEIQFYGTGTSEGTPVYRLWNSQQTANGGLGSHLWTTDRNEYEALPRLSGGAWRQEGVVWRGDVGFGYSMRTMDVTLPVTRDWAMTRTVTWHYPQFFMTDSSTTTALDKVNGEISASMQRKWQENQRPLNSGAHLSGDIDVVYYKDGIVSIEDTFDSGAGVLFETPADYVQGHRIYGHTDGVVDCPIYDLASGSHVDPWTYVGMTRSELLDATRRAIRTYYANRGRFGSVTIDDMLEGFDEYTSGADRNYYLCDKGLVYHGHMYEFFSRSEGMQHIMVVPFGNQSLFGADYLKTRY